jgi:hypothetical protein
LLRPLTKTAVRLAMSMRSTKLTRSTTRADYSVS